ncbi:MAG: Acetyl-coenzyme A carboxylase carboxyl transferase subunit alpha [Alphaproteobacteria bacterium MarineAlpha5_Bin9]|nr:MAG: Acetyl-coenzyme A carboxylase carboxyl transferase subunit alpha [Alphaproteobacteria bacterium MarineAlpha5_Bin9]|tara:strand:- start:20301 stop:21218 length:918 start_codon:yes stop_codon:yes gene_type:complete
MIQYLDFEKQIKIIDEKINNNNLNDNKLIENLHNERNLLIKKIYSNLSSWQRVQIARHPNRPHTLDYIQNIFSDFVNLSGDRKFSEDKAIIAGFGKIENISVMIIGTEKGNSMESRIKHNFGMAKPEGYRKAQRMFQIAEKFKLPIITLVDTAGAFPGKEAEERGQAESIAKCISLSLKIKTPIISIIIGEGGSGGAIALATADIVMMLENSIYSVISPEGCASILWRDQEATETAAESLKLTASECLKLNVINNIIPEKVGGAHRNREEQYNLVKKHILDNLINLRNISIEDLVNKRNNKFLEL